MANLLILGETFPRSVANYRGTYRAVPYHCDELPDDHEANQAFFWYLNEGGELGVVHDVSRAKHLVQAYRHISPPQHFDLLEAVVDDEIPEIGGEFQGIDLSCAFNYSVLSSGLRFSQLPNATDDDSERITPLLMLIESCFLPKLNANGLFDIVEDAVFCLDCMMAVQQISPGLLENSATEFDPVSLYRVRVN